MVNYINSTDISLCPKCGGQPTIVPAMDHYIWFARCGTCGWKASVRKLEHSSASALEHWETDVKHEKLKEEHQQ